MSVGVWEAPTRYFGRPRGISPDHFDLASRPAKVVQKKFLERFAAIEKMRDKS